MELENENENEKVTFGDSDDETPYAGPENRVCHRRETTDRREMVRFELGKEQRRSGNDRRKPSSVWEGREMY